MAEQDVALPTTIGDAVAHVRSGRADLEALISSLTKDQLTAPGPEKWSIKDHLVHLDIWTRALHDLLDGKPRFPRFLVSSVEEMRSVHIDVINDRILEKNRDRSLEDVVADFRDSLHGTIERLQAMSDADLACPYSSYVAEENPHSHEAIINWIAGNTWEHDVQHRGWIRDHFGV